MADIDARPIEERFRSLFVLGRGGMGSVEAALETRGSEGEEAFERVVALKRLLPERRDARRAEMFLREAKLAAMLDHPNVVRAHAYGEIGGELYLALEYVEGQPLSRVVAALTERGEHMSAALAAHVVAEVCEGLHAAHELRGENGQPLSVVHRDVSPQNVMVGYDGSVRLLDFGIAKIEAESVTKTGEVKGKTAYMSPEQAMGDPLDRRSDLFGVGALLFECIAGRRMWGEGTDMEVIRKLALESPPSLTDASSEVPAWMVALHARLVARAPSDRPASARAVAEELRAHEDASGVGEREAQVRALTALMQRCFADEADAERARLAEALERAAPLQAEALRESLLPRTPSATMRAATPVDEAPRAAEAQATAAPEAPASARSPKTFVIAGALAALALGAWLASRPPAPTPAPAPAPAPVPAPANASASASASASANAPASASASASANAPAPAPASSNAPNRPRPALARPTSPPPTVSAPRPSPAASALPEPSAKPYVDDKPF